MTSQILIGLLAFLALLLGAGACYQYAGAKRDAARFPPPGRLIDIGGTRLHIDVRGKGLPPVVLEAGIAATSLSWQLVQPEIAGLTQTVSYDRAGLGWSDAPRGARNIGQVVEELRCLLDHAGVAAPRILAGHSYGGLVVTAYAARYPAEVAGMVLIDPAAVNEWSDPTPRLRRMLRLGAHFSRRGALLARFGVPRFALQLLTGGARGLPHWIARATGGPAAGLIERMVGQIQKLPPALWPAIQSHWCDPKCFESMARYLEALPETAAAVKRETSAGLGDLPLIVLSSARATAAERADHEALSRQSSQGRIEVVSNSGHWIPLDRPDSAIRAIREMVQRAHCQ